MKTITLDQVMAKKPCENYPRAVIAKWFPGKRPTLRKLFDVAMENGVSHFDLIYHFAKYLTQKQRILFACDCAERACRIANWTDERSLNAIKVARLYANDKATREELKLAILAADAAAAASAYAAVYADAYAASAAAAAAAAAAVDVDVADRAARAARAAVDVAAHADDERKHQCEALLVLLERQKK